MDRRARQRWLDGHDDERKALYLLDARREVRGLDDRELAAFIARKQRDIAEHAGVRDVPLWIAEDNAARLQAALEEQKARARIARRGGPKIVPGATDVAAIKARYDLVDLVVQQWGAPDKAQRDVYWWRCQFHGEDTPSFNVKVSAQVFHCFGCNLGGDLIRWIELTEGLDFKDVLRKLGGETPREPHHVRLAD